MNKQKKTAQINKSNPLQGYSKKKISFLIARIAQSNALCSRNSVRLKKSPIRWVIQTIVQGKQKSESQKMFSCRSYSVYQDKRGFTKCVQLDVSRVQKVVFISLSREREAQEYKKVV